MRLVCRECSAAYEAPDSLFGPQPREVRCNRCGYQWTVVGPASQGETRAPLPVPTAMPMPAPAPAPVPLPPLAAQPTVPPAAPAAAPIAEPEPVAATLLPADTERLADTLAARPVAPPVLRTEPAAPSTRALLGDIPAEAADIDMPDAEERRLSHELSFGETERHPLPERRSRGRGLWLLILIVVVIVIAAILFKPQLVDAVPALGSVYASVGL